MKFILKKDWMEGEFLPSNVFISYGKKYQHDKVWGFTLQGGAEEIETSFLNGWYLRIELPFWKTQTYLDYRTFEHKTAPCRKIFLWMSRTIAGHTKPTLMRTSQWVPHDVILPEQTGPVVA